ncbi:MAG: hypothetical protein R6W94_06800 [Spirochaetia bacterium]
MAKTGVTALVIVLLIAVLLLAAGCETMDSVADGAGTVKGVADRAGSVSAKAGTVDFRSGEQLCSYTERDTVTANSYKAAKIITPPSEATQNQAEVLFADGDKMWTRFVLRTHKPSKAELSVGDMVLYMPHFSDDEEVTAEHYRKQRWEFGRVTSTDELFKDMVEVDGEPLRIKWLRVPDESVG